MEENQNLSVYIITLVPGDNYDPNTGVITIPVSISRLTAIPLVKRRLTDENPSYEFEGNLRTWDIIDGNLIITTNPKHDYTHYRIVYKGTNSPPIVMEEVMDNDLGLMDSEDKIILN